MAFTSTVLTNVPTPIFTSVASFNAITCMYFCNAGTQPTNFCVYAVPSGQTATVDRAIYFNVSLTPNDTYVLDTEKLMLGVGDSVHANLIMPVSNPDIKVIATVSSIEV